jgi:hypothetical protein
MTNQIRESLDFIIRGEEIKTVFQPIISLRDGGVLGHEALSRITCESEIRNPEILFTAAGKYNRLWELELLCRTKALEAAFKLSGHYGFTLHQNKPISGITNKDFLSVDFNTPISNVASMAMSRPCNKLYDVIVITENNKYLVTVTIKDLLQKTIEIEVSVAKHQMKTFNNVFEITEMLAEMKKKAKHKKFVK